MSNGNSRGSRAEKGSADYTDDRRLVGGLGGRLVFILQDGRGMIEGCGFAFLALIGLVVVFFKAVFGFPKAAFLFVLKERCLVAGREDTASPGLQDEFLGVIPEVGRGVCDFTIPLVNLLEGDHI